MNIFRFFTKEKAANATNTTPQPTSTQPTIILWKDSEYKKSLEVFKKYFSTLVFMAISKDEFYNKVEELGLGGQISYSQNNPFETFPEALVIMMIDIARNLANAYTITLDNVYRLQFVKLYNAFAEILDPSNKMCDEFEDLKSAVETLEQLFKEPDNRLL